MSRDNDANVCSLDHIRNGAGSGPSEPTNFLKLEGSSGRCGAGRRSSKSKSWLLPATRAHARAQSSYSEMVALEVIWLILEVD